MSTVVTMRDMLEAGVHFGHKTRYWNPKMRSYIYGARDKIHIIDLEQTLPLFDNAMKLLSYTTAKRGKVLFVGTKRAARDVIKEEATRCGMPYVDHRWLGGMLTNYKTVRKSIKRLKELEAMFEKGTFGIRTKKEILTLEREKNKLECSLGGIKDMGGLPDMLFVIDVGNENIAVTEANRLGIPVIGIVDTNNSPDGVNHIIPGNDDSIRAIRLYVGSADDKIFQGREKSGTSVPDADDDFVEMYDAEKHDMDLEANNAEDNISVVMPTPVETRAPVVADEPEAATKVVVKKATVKKVVIKSATSAKKTDK